MMMKVMVYEDGSRLRTNYNQVVVMDLVVRTFESI
jgi:hypothetical protein